MGGRETPWECRLSAPHEKWGAGMWGETPSGKLLVHHDTLNSKTLTHQLGGGGGGDKRSGKWG